MTQPAKLRLLLRRSWRRTHDAQAQRRHDQCPTHRHVDHHARAYVSGDVLIDGDLMEGLSALERIADPELGPGVVIDMSMRRALVMAALRLGVVGPPPRPPQEEARLGGLRHSRSRDAQAIAHHYD